MVFLARAHCRFRNHLIMCLAIPGKIQSINKSSDELLSSAIVSFGGLTKEVNISMVPEAKVGDYTLVHVGVAISIINESEALKTLNYLKEIGDLDELQD